MTKKLNAKSETAFLDAAEKLFAENGYEGTRVRAIAELSHVNLGALHYYWGSKEALFAAVWRRRMEPLVESRRAALRELLDGSEDEPPRIEKIVSVWITGGLGLGLPEEGPSAIFQRLYGRALVDPSPAVQSVVSEYFDENGRTLIQLLRQACPELEDSAIYWRMHCLLGSILYAHIGNTRLQEVASDLDADTSLEAGAPELIDAIVAAFKTQRA